MHQNYRRFRPHRNHPILSNQMEIGHQCLSRHHYRHPDRLYHNRHLHQHHLGLSSDSLGLSNNRFRHRPSIHLHHHPSQHYRQFRRHRHPTIHLDFEGRRRNHH